MYKNVSGIHFLGIVLKKMSHRSLFYLYSLESLATDNTTLFFCIQKDVSQRKKILYICQKVSFWFIFKLLTADNGCINKQPKSA